MYGIRTIGDLRRSDPSTLSHKLGQHHAQHLVSLASGRDDRKVEGSREAKSIGAEETFERDLVDREAIAGHLLAQAERVAERLRATGVVARGVTLKYKLSDFTVVSRQTTLTIPSDDGQVLYQAVRALLWANPPAGPIRLCGVSAHKIEPRPLPGLFMRPAPPPGAARPPEGVDDDTKRYRLNKALDSIHQKHGASSLVRARLLELDLRPNAPEPPKPGRK
ncbi:MAG: hypothetical protein U1F43_20055 [Myxococcota bacterium]